MSQQMEGLLEGLERHRIIYRRRARGRERVYWIGSCVAAVCSAVAALSIAANLGIWHEPYGRFVAGGLAIVPVVWSAIERSLRLRQLSAFNYGVATQLRALDIEVRYGAEPDISKAALRYASILRTASEAFGALINREDETANRHTQAAIPP